MCGAETVPPPPRRQGRETPREPARAPTDTRIDTDAMNAPADASLQVFKTTDRAVPASPPPRGPLERHMAGLMPAEEMLAIVARGAWTPARCAALGPIPDAVADIWLRSGAIARETLVRLTVAHWRPDQALPRAHAVHAASFKTPGDLLLHAPMPGTPASELRYAYATRMLAALALFKMGISRLHGPGALPPSENCAICGDAAVVSLEACAHGADACADCVKQWMQVGASSERCPSTGCKAVVTPDDALRVGAGASVAQRIAAFLAQRLVAQQPHWRSCGTEDCPGGVEVPKDAAYVHLDCGVCGTHQRLLGSDAVGDLDNLRRMVFTYLGRLGGSRAMLPCSHCGLASEKISGCRHVSCPACTHRWSFVPNHVPQAGSMVDMGLFEGLEPGSNVSAAGLADAVLQNCRRLRLFEELL